MSPIEQISQHLADPQSLPQTPKQEGAANPARRNSPGVDIRQDQAALTVPGDRCGKPVQFAAGGQRILSAQRFDGALADRLALADALHEIKVAMASRDSFDDEHPAVVTQATYGIYSDRANSQNMLLLHLMRSEAVPTEFCGVPNLRSILVHGKLSNWGKDGSMLFFENGQHDPVPLRLRGRTLKTQRYGAAEEDGV